MNEDENNLYLCNSCEYKWVSRKKFGEPAQCPSCHSDDIVNLDVEENEEKKYCDYCGKRISKTIVKCKNCEKIVCNNCFKECICCEKNFCKGCINEIEIYDKKMKSGKEWICEDCVEELAKCEDCEKIFDNPDCLVECTARSFMGCCGKLICKDCSKKCEKCGEYFCAKHIENHNCQKRL